ncbi:MAG: Hydrogenase expression protein [Deltaproteobacteria bacterium]|nr:Hydrogenase expression protein [Deltaproteobacteria bacterium]
MRRTSSLRFPIGKLPIKTLERLLKQNRIKDRRVIVGPGIGEDAAVIDTGGPRYLIAKTDPITFTAEQIGWYAVHINANDIATKGGRPMWYLATLLLPEELTTETMAETIFHDTLKACESIGVSLIGGHTEITTGLTRPIVVGQMLGEVAKDKLIRADGAKPGDAIILTKGIAIEGTAVIARERASDLFTVMDEYTLARCRNFVYQPGISVLKEAIAATEAGVVHAMHDPTEGGLATALHELAWAAGVGMRVDAEAIPVFAESQALCNHYHLDPLGLIASGALLIVAPTAETDRIVSALHAQAIAATVIGKITDKSHGVKMLSADGLRSLPLFEQDELTRI